MNLGFIGLGVMGSPMAGHLLSQGYDVSVWNRSAAKAKMWVNQYNGKKFASIAELAQNVDVVITCIGGDDDLRQCVYGEEGIAAHLTAKSIHIDHSTVSAEVAREIAAHYQTREIAFLDAPISGGEIGAQNGALTVMVGGDEAAFERAKPVMASYAKAVTLMGESGAGQLTKMVNQICIAGLVQGLSEGIAFAQRAGLDGARVVDVISKGAAQSWQLDNRALTMLEDRFDFGFAVDFMRKDLRFCLEEASRNGARLPVTALVDQFYAALQARGEGRADTSSLVRLLREQPE